MDIELFGKKIGDGQPTFIIAEIGLNHNGSIELAKRLIDVAVETGCDAVKFQKRHVDGLATKELLDAQDNRFPEFGKTYREVREHVELSEEQLKSLKEYSQEKKIHFFVTPFDIHSLEMIDRIGVEAYKSASHNLTHLPLLEEMIKRGKPIIASTGMANLEEVDKAVALLKASNIPFVLLQCVSSYPTAAELVNLRMIDFMRDRFQVPVGYSGHEHMDTHHLPTLAAVARGACVVERHITLDNTMVGFDHKISVNPTDLKDLVHKIRLIDQMMGDGIKRLLPEELAKREQQRVSLVSSRDIPQGHILTQDDLCFKAPGTGLPCARLNELIGKKATRDIEEDCLVNFEMFD